VKLQHSLWCYYRKGARIFSHPTGLTGKGVLRLIGHLLRGGLRNVFGFSNKLPDGRLRAANTILDESFTEPCSRYFYCATESKKERNIRLDRPNPRIAVKPLALTTWLAKLDTAVRWPAEAPSAIQRLCQ
jgi:hypothetical protein